MQVARGIGITLCSFLSLESEALSPKMDQSKLVHHPFGHLLKTFLLALFPFGAPYRPINFGQLGDKIDR